MKIHFLLSSLSTGGAERVASLLTAAWASAGHDVTLTATFSRCSPVEIALAENVRYRSMAAELAHRPWLMRTWPFRVLELARTFRSERPDIVCSFLTNVNVAAIAAARLAGVPVIVSERIYPPAMPTPLFWRLLRRWLYPRADLVVMQTSGGLEWLEHEIPAALGVIVGNPVQVPMPAAAPFLDSAATCGPGRKILLSIGRLADQKRFDLLIDAFASIGDDLPEWDLVILGEGPLRTSLEDRVGNHGLQERIALPGRAGNPQDWLDRAGAFALVSDFEGFPNALLEALASGLPALAKDCPTGPNELIENGLNGVLLPAGAGVSEIAAGLQFLLTSTWPGPEADCAGLRNRFSCLSISNEWLKIFEEVRGSSADVR